MSKLAEISEVMERVIPAAVAYHELTGKPLGIAGEVGEYLAAKHLNLELAEARTAGFDATDKTGRLVQIKARATQQGKKRGQVGNINLEQEFDVVVLVLMNERFEATAIYEADRGTIEAALMKPGSKARNERGSLAVSKFISIGKQVWASDALRGCG